MAPKPAGGKTEPVADKKAEHPDNEEGKKTRSRDYFRNLKDNNRDYWTLGCGPLKILSIGCLIAACIIYIEVVEQPIIKPGMKMEISFLTFFFFVYVSAFNRYCTFVLWPLSDIINSIFAIFFLVAILISILEKGNYMKISNLIPLILIGVTILFIAFEMCLHFEYFSRERMTANYLTAPKRPEGKAKK